MIAPRSAAEMLALRDQIAHFQESDAWAAICEILKANQGSAARALHDPGSSESELRYNRGLHAGLTIALGALDTIERQANHKRRANSHEEGSS